MGTGYTRNDVSNNIADGNIISASDIDGEYDAIEAAFNSSTGHTHDGTAAEGAPITVVGPVQDLVVSATEVKPKTTNTLDLGTSALLYKDAYLQGNMYFRDTALKIVSSGDGQLDIDADVELELVAPTVDIDASTALTVDTASTTFTSTLFNVTGSANITGDLDVDNINIDGNTIISTDTNGAINITPNGTGAVNITATTNITGDLDVDNININGNTIISTDTNGDINISPDGTGTVVIDTDLDVDNINIDGNTIISTDTNGDINLSPDGTGTVVIDTDLDVDNINVNGNTVSSTDTNGDINLSPNGTGTVVINTDLDVDNININGNTIISTDTNGNIALTPDGTGEVDISKVDIASGEIDGTTIGANSAAAGTFTTLSATTLGSAVDLNSQALTNANIDSGAIDGVTLGTNSAVTEAQVDNININGNTIISTDTNGNIALTPNGTGEVDISKVDIDAGAIDGTTIGASSAAAGTFTTLTASGDLTVDTNTLYVDSTNNRVGIGESSPLDKIHSSGDIRLTSGTSTTRRMYALAGASAYSLGSSGGAAIVFQRDGSSNDEIAFETHANGVSHSERMRITAAGAVGIGTSSPSGGVQLDIRGSGVIQLVNSDNIQLVASSGGSILKNVSNNPLLFGTNNSERMRIDSSGNLLVGTTSNTIYSSSSETGSQIGDGYIATARAATVAYLNRLTTDGSIVEFRKGGTTVGSISSVSDDLHIYSSTSGHAGLRFASGYVGPTDNTGASTDNTFDFGAAVYRWDDIYATNGTIQTSDENEKQQIASLTDAEMTAAKSISALFKTFKWNDSVAEKGDAARTHTGVIAQDVQQAMTDAGLDAGDYAFFISSTWWEADEDYTDDDGNAQTRTVTYDTQAEAPEGATERTRLGIRYPELLAFIGAATEHRLADIETRLDALEAN